MQRWTIRRCTWLKWAIGISLILLLAVLVSFGILHIVIVLSGHSGFFPGSPTPLQALSDSSHQWNGNRISTTDFENITKNVQPIPCHSHNDYLRPIPLFDALSVGCTSVEADIWLPSGNDTELLVGHKKNSLSKDRTLRSLYLDPITEILDSSNSSIFTSAPNQTLVLLLDFKSNGTLLLPYVQEHLELLHQKQLLSFWNGSEFVTRPITIVASGDAPYDDLIQANGSRYIFSDAPLAQLSDNAPYNSTNSFYASTSFAATVGKVTLGRLSTKQLNTIRSQIREAQARGLKVRYWDTPAWPLSLRNYVWQTLMDEGADVLNVDDLYSAAFLDWGWVRHSWFDG